MVDTVSDSIAPGKAAIMPGGSETLELDGGTGVLWRPENRKADVPQL